MLEKFLHKCQILIAMHFIHFHHVRIYCCVVFLNQWNHKIQMQMSVGKTENHSWNSCEWKKRNLNKNTKGIARYAKRDDVKQKIASKRTRETWRDGSHAFKNRHRFEHVLWPRLIHIYTQTARQSRWGRGTDCSDRVFTPTSVHNIE